MPDPGVPLRSHIRQFRLYLACSAIALCVDYGVYWSIARSELTALAWAAVIGYAAGMIVAYALMIRRVFPRGWLHSRRGAEATLFAASGLLGLVLTYVTAALVVRLLGEQIHTAKLIAVAVSFTGVFMLRKLVVFRA